ncbi:MAG: hypothetical protein Q4G26_07140 [Paracoccus sp. (in: a-proteobacteria)]|nr:hypothetical protein [Paracoccus sp. (in: a-proteobacteria)]
MSIRNFGQITSLQLAMLMLSGFQLTRENGATELILCENEKLSVMSMIEGSKILNKTTEQDFGYSLAKWHDFLVNSEKFSAQYMWPRTWDKVRDSVLREIANPDRSRLENLAGQSDS